MSVTNKAAASRPGGGRIRVGCDDYGSNKLSPSKTSSDRKRAGVVIVFGWKLYRRVVRYRGASC